LIRSSVWGFATLALIAGLAPPARGIAPGEASARLEAMEREIERLELEKRRLAGEERGILGRIETLSAEARLLDARVEKLELETEQARRALEGSEEELVRLGAELEARRSTLARTMILMHRLGPLGRYRPLMSRHRAESVAAGIRFASTLVTRSAREVEAVRVALAEIEALQETRRRTEAELASALGQAAEARANLEATVRERRSLLASIRERRQHHEQAIGELERAQDELAQVVAAGEAPPGWRPALDVRAFRGLLPMPAAGRVSRAFGNRRDPRVGVVMPHRGWDIDAPFGAHVRSPFQGTVVWTGWLRGYGLVVVVDHGGGVHTVFAHLSIVVAEKGQQIGQGEDIGRVGDTGSLAGAYLYFEVREQGKAVDPALWIDPARR
jgi:septal ring factor EnvC (AmiA/AmiB activator)